MNMAKTFVPQSRVEELEAEVARLRAALKVLLLEFEFIPDGQLAYIDEARKLAREPQEGDEK